MSQIAIITGACGGIGRAGARMFGRTRDLFLTDIHQDRLDQFAATLREEGFVVAGVLAGDLAEPGVAEAVVKQARAAGALRAVFHTAGLSPTLAGPEPILKANVTATEHLLRALEQATEPGLVAVLVASLAAHMVPAVPPLEALCAKPLDETFPANALAAIAAMAPAGSETERAGIAYSFSKLAVIRMVESRGAAWGKAGARIVSISPGMIDTPMGRSEIEHNPPSAAVLHMTPLGIGRPSDIAGAALFLASEDARFVTGCDFRVDGGAAPALKAAQVGPV